MVHCCARCVIAGMLTGVGRESGERCTLLLAFTHGGFQGGARMSADLDRGTGPGCWGGDAPAGSPADQPRAAAQDRRADRPRPTFTPRPPGELRPVNHLDSPQSRPLRPAMPAGDGDQGGWSWDEMQRARDAAPSARPDFTTVRDHVASLGVEKPPASPGALREAAATWQERTTDLTVGATRQGAGDNGTPRPKGASPDSSTPAGHSPRTPSPYAPRHAVTEQRATPPAGTRIVRDQPRQEARQEAAGQASGYAGRDGHDGQAGDERRDQGADQPAGQPDGPGSADQAPPGDHSDFARAGEEIADGDEDDEDLPIAMRTARKTLKEAGDVIDASHDLTAPVRDAMTNPAPSGQAVAGVPGDDAISDIPASGGIDAGSADSVVAVGTVLAIRLAQWIGHKVRGDNGAGHAGN
jgi:hypothetical protein